MTAYLGGIFNFIRYLISAYGAYIKRKIGDIIFSGYINIKFPKYVITFWGCKAIRL